MIRSLQMKPSDLWVEIGPGQGALTESLLKSGAPIHAVEFDKDLIPYLQQRFPALQLIQADALEFDFSSLSSSPDQKMRIVGNLPYNISTPLLFHLIEHIHTIRDMHVMLQKEVVDRICAEPGGKDYGRLTIMLQYQLKPERLFEVPDHCFYPPPKVQSAVVRLTPYATSPFEQVSIKALNKVVLAAFSHRRKTLGNALKGVISKEEMQSLDIDATMRPETLSVGQFVSLAKLLNLDKPNESST